MKSLFIALVTITSLTSSAFAKTAQCTLTVDGKNYIKGACQFTASKGGSFQITGKNGYFAVVNVTEDGIADGFWNDDEGTPASHAHSSLGVLVRNGGCWTNDRAVVCAE